MTQRLFWICCLIIVGSVATLWFLNQRPSHSDTSDTNNTTTPSVSFENVVMVVNSDEGKPRYKFIAPKYWLYPIEQRSEFDNPDISIYGKSGSNLYAKANRGETFDNNDVITLIGDVKITQPKSKDNPHKLKVMTEKLTVLPDKEEAKTDILITAIRGPEMVTAIGMRLDFKEQILYLHNDVKGHYVP